MNNTLLYDVALKFESELFVSVLDDSFEEMMVSLTGRKSGIGSVYSVSHDMNITNTPIVPDDEEIENLRQTIFREMKSGFSEMSDVEVRSTKFIGITSIKQKKN